MTFKPARLLACLLAVAVLPSLANAENLAVVNGKAIPSARVDTIVKNVVAQSRGQQVDSPDLRAKIKEDLINREVLLQEAQKQGFGNQPDVKEELEMARQTIVIRAMVASFVKKNPVSDAEIKSEYDKFKAQSGDKEYHARHILVEKEDEAKVIIAKLKGGTKFEDLAKQSKDTGSAANGGDLNWAPPASYVKPFADAMVALKKGEVSHAPVKSQFGFHVIKLEDVRTAKVPSLDEVKPRISEALQQKKLQAFQDNLRKKAKIQ